jgi:hypothetical protein
MLPFIFIHLSGEEASGSPAEVLVAQNDRFARSAAFGIAQHQGRFEVL